MDAVGNACMVIVLVEESLQPEAFISITFTVAEPALPHNIVTESVAVPLRIVPPATFQLYVLPTLFVVVYDCVDPAHTDVEPVGTGVGSGLIFTVVVPGLETQVPIVAMTV